jgi:hypothetical protein
MRNGWDGVVQALGAAPGRPDIARANQHRLNNKDGFEERVIPEGAGPVNPVELVFLLF